MDCRVKPGNDRVLRNFALSPRSYPVRALEVGTIPPLQRAAEHS